MLNGPVALPPGVWDVDVSNNAFRGKLPRMARFTNIESFVANGNNFTGGVPGKGREGMSLFVGGREGPQALEK